MEQLKPTPDHALARPDMAINAGLRGIENKSKRCSGALYGACGVNSHGMS